MSNYPDYKQLMESRHELEQGHADDFSQSGTQHSRQQHALQYHRFTLFHPLTPAEFDDLLTFYTDEPRDEHQLIYHSVEYTVKFLRPPQISQNRADRKYLTEVQMRGYLTGSI